MLITIFEKSGKFCRNFPSPVGRKAYLVLRKGVTELGDSQAGRNSACGGSNASAVTRQALLRLLGRLISQNMAC
jgi:hypothetical protein